MSSQGGERCINHEKLHHLRLETGTGFERVLALFLKNLPGRLSALSEAWLGNDRLLLRQTAHKLKGTSATFCADDFSLLCAQLEKSAEEAPAEHIEQLLQQVAAEGEQVRIALHDLLLQTLAER
ncbi:MAG: Hpt domain-containing protein [Magnetococcales bacterium]|nr:Hpt domain-containing protein [Magnetococcales bacterium]MBF0115215.1 Hpt domain-containing protein [Magnetococcales bacterium]